MIIIATNNNYIIIAKSSIKILYCLAQKLKALHLYILWQSALMIIDDRSYTVFYRFF